MAERVDELFGALLTLIATPAERPRALDVPPGMPAFMRALPAQHGAIARN